MNYQRIYDTIIGRGKNRILEGYKEKHHIVPRCLGGTDDTKNLVDLTAEEHYVAHQLLVKIYPNNIKLVSAAMFMTANGAGQGRSRNKTYGWLKRRYSAYMKENNPNKDGVARLKYIEEFGVPERSLDFVTKEWCDAISKRMTGDSNPMRGTKPWKHGRATDYTKSIWGNADEIYKIWLQNDKPSYCRLLSLTENGNYTDSDYNTKVGPFMNLVKYFRNGWVPTEDTEWKELKEIV